MSDLICLENHKIGKDCPVFIIAEVGVNHNGDLPTAKKLIEEAANAGADCVKFQTFKAERVVTKNAPKAQYQLKTTAVDESQEAMLKKLEMDMESDLGIDSIKRVEILNHGLFQLEGFSGNTADYANPLNSFLDSVLESRQGIPITLSIIYVEVAQRLNLDSFVSMSSFSFSGSPSSSNSAKAARAISSRSKS